MRTYINEMSDNELLRLYSECNSFNRIVRDHARDEALSLIRDQNVLTLWGAMYNCFSHVIYDELMEFIESEVKEALLTYALNGELAENAPDTSHCCTPIEVDRLTLEQFLDTEVPYRHERFTVCYPTAPGTYETITFASVVDYVAFWEMRYRDPDAAILFRQDDKVSQIWYEDASLHIELEDIEEV